MASLEVCVISLNPDLSLLPFYQLFNHVTLVKARDFRRLTPQEAYNKGLVTLTAADTWSSGYRKYHREFIGGGAVGLQRSVHDVLSRSRDTNTWTLVCEEDCVISRELPRTIATLQQKHALHPFDAVVFGAAVSRTAPSGIDDFVYPRSAFYGTHCWLVSPAGHSRLARLFSRPMEVQMDTYMAQLSITGSARILVHVGVSRLARQALHVSTIQVGCPLCDVNAYTGCAAPRRAPIAYTAIGILFGALLGALSAVLATMLMKKAI